MELLYDGEIQIRKLVLGRFETNCYLLLDPATGRSAIVDAPDEADRILAAVEGTQVEHILMTHAHGDHIQALSAVRQATGAPVSIHASEAERLPSAADSLLEHGQTVTLGSLALQVIHAPGHTPGSLCYLFGKHLLGGDVLFPGGPGHTRTPQDFRQIVQSITSRLYTLDPQTVVYPGHGEGTTIGRSQEEYAGFSSRQHPPDLCGDVLWESS